jgi:antitoxin (DNA-binding transcriptional repressor) of toxin-antitoxin stability system
MEVLYISEAEAVRDIASLLDKVRAGAEIVIVNEDSTVAVLTPPGARLEFEEPEPGHDEWFRAQVQEGLDCDPATDLDGDEVEAYFAKKREAALQKLQGSLT